MQKFYTCIAHTHIHTHSSQYSPSFLYFSLSFYNSNHNELRWVIRRAWVDSLDNCVVLLPFHFEFLIIMKKYCALLEEGYGMDGLHVKSIIVLSCHVKSWWTDHSSFSAAIDKTIIIGNCCCVVCILWQCMWDWASF